MKTICIRTKLKSNSLNEVRQWFQTLEKRTNEILESLENEGVFVESVFLDKHGEDLYLVHYMKAKDVAFAYEVFNKSTLAIDHYYKECWSKFCEGRVVLEELFDIDRIDI